MYAMPDEGFVVQGEAGNILRVAFAEVYGFPDSTSCWGGYDVRADLKIKSNSFEVNAEFWTSTGEIFLLFQELQLSNKVLSGSPHYDSCEGHLSFTAMYDNMGHVTISGRFAEQMSANNTLNFEFESDQTFIQTTILQLQMIANKYGGMQEIKA